MDTEIVNGKNGNFNLRLQTFLKRYSVADCRLCGNPSGYGIPTLKDVWGTVFSGGMSKIEAEVAINKICAAVGSESALLNFTPLLLTNNELYIP